MLMLMGLEQRSPAAGQTGVSDMLAPQVLHHGDGLQAPPPPVPPTRSRHGDLADPMTPPSSGVAIYG